MVEAMARGRVHDWDEIFLNAALEPHRWSDSLATLASATGSAHGQLVAVRRMDDAAFNIINDFDWSHIKLFQVADGNSPDVNFRIAASDAMIQQGYFDTLLHEAHYDTALATLSATRARGYLDFCAAADIPFGCQVNLVVDKDGLIGFALLRKRREGPTNAETRTIFAGAATAARRAMRLQERLENNQAAVLAGAFDSIGITAFVLDRRGEVIAMSGAAETLATKGDVGLSGGRLFGRGVPLSLETAVDALTAPNGLAHIRFRIDPPNDQPGLFVEGFRLPRRDWSFGRLPHAILIINAPRRDRAGIVALLTALFGLSPAEADIAMRLFDDKSRSEIAEQRGVSAETVRGQIKRIYEKTGVDSEAALMRLLSSIMA